LLSKNENGETIDRRKCSDDSSGLSDRRHVRFFCITTFPVRVRNPSAGEEGSGREAYTGRVARAAGSSRASILGDTGAGRDN
jgi:hypothetical protein